VGEWVVSVEAIDFDRGNLSQTTNEIRRYCYYHDILFSVADVMLINTVHELLFVFLQHPNLDIVWTACGVFMNMTSDRTCRPSFRDCGLTVLLDVRFGRAFFPHISFTFEGGILIRGVSGKQLQVNKMANMQALEAVGGLDWELSAILCKALWNLFDDEHNLGDPVAGQVEDALLDLLGAFPPRIHMHVCRRCF
jgi:hypothetical protein